MEQNKICMIGGWDHQACAVCKNILAPTFIHMLFPFQLVNSSHPLGSNSLGILFAGGAFGFVIRESSSSTFCQFGRAKSHEPQNCNGSTKAKKWTTRPG